MTGIPDKFILALINRLGDENVLTQKADCWPYGGDNSRQHICPAAVVFATSTDQIQSILNLCNEYSVPLVTRGRGTGTTGATVPRAGEIVLSLERMNKILQLSPADRYIVVEPGVTNSEVQQAAAAHGFFWAPDPTSADFCTVGGNLAYNSAGPRAVKYGTPRENTLGLKALTGTGQLITAGVRTTKGVVGYDLTRLLIGSEGTLAIITEATLKLIPLPETIHTLQLFYDDINSAAQAVSSIMAQPVIPCALEFIDHQAIDIIRDYSSLELPKSIGAMLMVEVDGSQASMGDAITAVQQAASNPGLQQMHTARTDEERESLWKIRKALSPALRQIAPKKINEDVVVPVSAIPALLAALNKLASQYKITIVNFGHAGNGNIHVNLLIDPEQAEQLKNAQACLSDVFDCVLSLGGSLSGEHGVGLAKKDFVSREINQSTLMIMKQLKALFDPNNILNPGKTLPD